MTEEDRKSIEGTYRRFTWEEREVMRVAINLRKQKYPLPKYDELIEIYDAIEMEESAAATIFDTPTLAQRRLARKMLIASGNGHLAPDDGSKALDDDIELEELEKAKSPSNRLQ